MEKLLSPYFWFYAVVLSVWVMRARQALATLKEVPAMTPLTPGSENLSAEDSVTVIVPAKDEEKNIGECVDRFLNQDYPNIQLIIVNDRSGDRTESILIEKGLTQLNSPKDVARAGYINLTEQTPEGWTGKNFAIHSAIPYARGRWFLFSDADTRHHPASVRTSLDYAKRNGLSFLSLLPRCITAGFLEKCIQPVAMLLLGLWFPLSSVNHPQSKMYFANGQYILMNEKAYRKTGGHRAVKGNFLEDFALMKCSKESGLKAQCLLGAEIYGTRMYDSVAAMWRGWRRIYLHAFESKPFVLARKILNVLFSSVLPFILIFPLYTAAFNQPFIHGFAFGLAVPVLIFVLATLIKAFRVIKANPVFAFFYPFASVFMMMVFIDAFWMAVTKQKTVWR